MGNQLSTETLSSRDSSGHSYWVDFDWKSFAKGDKKKCYLGCLNGHGPRAGEKVVVKAYIEEMSSRRSWKFDKHKAKTANLYLSAFREKYSNMDASISINLPFLALMDTVSKMNRLFGARSKSRSLNDNEWVGIEKHIPGQFKHFCASDANLDQERALWLETFSHFTYHHSKGALVVCDFQGVQNGRSYNLTNPVIHSNGSQFGSKDNGVQGINGFFKSHRCNDVCRHWAKMMPLSPPPAFEDINFPTSDSDSSLEDIYLDPDELSITNILPRGLIPSAPPGYGDG